MAQQQFVSTSQGESDPKSALALAETREQIEEFVLDFCGIKIVKDGVAPAKKLRYSKPQITYEFAMNIAQDIYLMINTTTARTDYNDALVNFYINNKYKQLGYVFATQGFENLISDAVWDKILDLSKPHKSGQTKTLPNNTTIKLNTWAVEYGIDWDYNKEVNVDMLRIIKRLHPELENESFYQDITLRNIASSVIFYIEGGARRSWNHLTLNHEKVIHKETFMANTDKDLNTQDNKIDAVKQMIRGNI